MNGQRRFAFFSCIYLFQGDLSGIYCHPPIIIREAGSEFSFLFPYIQITIERRYYFINRLQKSLCVYFYHQGKNFDLPLKQQL